MGKVSQTWLRVLSKVLRYYATITAIGTIGIDICIICSITPNWLNLFIGCSLFSCTLNYIGVRALGYCKAQRHLIWLTAHNTTYNIAVISFPCIYRSSLEILFILFLVIFISWAIIQYKCYCES